MEVQRRELGSFCEAFGIIGIKAPSREKKQNYKRKNFIKRRNNYDNNYHKKKYKKSKGKKFLNKQIVRYKHLQK